MIHLPGALLGCAIFAGVGWLFTWPLELRAHRWARIAFSMPFAFLFSNALGAHLHGIRTLLGGFTLFCGVMSAFFLAFVWRDILAHYGAGAVGRLIYGDMNARAAGPPDFRCAKGFQRFGELPEALEEVRAELKNDPLNYEGLLLLAELHQRNGAPGQALRALRKASSNVHLSSDQRKIIEERHQKLEEMLLVEQMNRRS